MRGVRPDLSRRAVALLETAPTLEGSSDPSHGWIGQAVLRGEFSPEKAVIDQLIALDAWATTTEDEAARMTARFWFLKGPAFGCALLASVAQSFGYGRAVILLGALAALAVAIDAAWTGPTHPLLARATRDIRNLENSVKLKWDKVRISHPDAKDPARSEQALAILDGIDAKRDEIGKYLANPQGSPRRDSPF
jgi:hypothetical protein